MFFRKNPLKKLKEEAIELLRTAQKIYDYRHDLMSPQDINTLHARREALVAACENVDVTKVVLQKAYDELKDVLRRWGGSLYPVGFWVENAEMLIVAAILAIGFKTFFIQPFKIPTNSMYPTYAGMLPHVYGENEKKPKPMVRFWNWVTQGASHYEVKAPCAGECLIPLCNPSEPRKGAIYYEVVRGVKWFAVPTNYQQYTFYVGDQKVTFRVPYDFPIDDVVAQTFFPPCRNMEEVIAQDPVLIGMNGRLYLKAPRTYQTNDVIMQFDILTGDMVFVDRFSYHFRSPRVGEAIIFRTRKIELLKDDKYYIKRLVGLTGDKIKLVPPVLYRNGHPITGSIAFERNLKREGLYGGYTPRWNLANEREVVVSEGGYYALGDNSRNSLDSRYWGTVPQKEVLGRALFILHPFTSRWGLAK